MNWAFASACLLAATLLPSPSGAEEEAGLVSVSFLSAIKEEAYEVTLDSGETGRTPFTVAVQSGWHRLAVRGLAAYDQDLFVWPGPRGVVRVGSSEAVSATEVRVEAADARTIRIDGQVTCQTPCTLLLDPGGHELKVEADPEFAKWDTAGTGRYTQTLVVPRHRRLLVRLGEKRAAWEEDKPPSPPFAGPRLRLGLGLEWEPSQLTHAGEREGVMGAEVHLRLGLQVSRNLAVYYQGSAAAANTLRVRFCMLGCSGSNENYWLFVHASAVLAEATLWDRLQVALGPALFVAGPSWVSPTAGRAAGLGWGGVARLGAVPKPDSSSVRRLGVSIGLQGQAAVFEKGSLLSLGIALGYDRF